MTSYTDGGARKEYTYRFCGQKVKVYNGKTAKMYNLVSEYCKTLIIRVTLFSQGQQPRFIHETLFSQFVIDSSIILALEIIGEDFIFASLCSREFTRK